MNEQKFISDNIATWEKLEFTLKKLNSKGFNSFDKNELNDFFAHYNNLCSHLSYAQTYFPTSEITMYLNNLASSAYSFIYFNKKFRFKNFIMFFILVFPMILVKNIKYFIISTSIFVGGTLFSFLYTMLNSENALAFLPQSVYEQLNFQKHDSAIWNRPLASTSILTNNISVGIMAFAFGITLGLGTLYLLINNAFLIGAIAGIAYNTNYSYLFWSKILPHGVLELFAIFICGAAGLMVGYSIINPKNIKRKDSFIINGKKAVKLMIGTIPIFITAGFIEGFFTPSGVPELFKYIFSLITLLFIIVYIALGNYFGKKSSYKQIVM